MTWYEEKSVWNHIIMRWRYWDMESALAFPLYMKAEVWNSSCTRICPKSVCTVTKESGMGWKRKWRGVGERFYFVLEVKWDIHTEPLLFFQVFAKKTRARERPEEMSQNSGTRWNVDMDNNDKNNMEHGNVLFAGLNGVLRKLKERFLWFFL